jgi:hypothetical protein
MIDDDLRLRTIVVSTRAALARAGGPEVAIIKARSANLLHELAEHIQADGADPRILMMIAAAQEALAE